MLGLSRQLPVLKNILLITSIRCAIPWRGPFCSSLLSVTIYLSQVSQTTAGGWGEWRSYHWAIWSCTVQFEEEVASPDFCKWLDLALGSPWLLQHKAPHWLWAELSNCAGGCRDSAPCHWSDHGSQSGYLTIGENKRGPSYPWDIALSVLMFSTVLLC